MSSDLRRDRASLQRRLASVTQAVLVVFLAFLTGVAVVGFGVSALPSEGAFSRGEPLFSVSTSVFQFVGFGIGVGGYVALRGEWDLIRAQLPTRRDLGWIVVGTAVILLSAVVLGRALSELGVSVAQNQVVEAGRRDPELFLYMIPVSLLLVGPFEELVFRGAVQGTLRRTFRPNVAVVVASAMFGVAHWLALTGAGGRLPYIAVAAGLGLVLGYVYERTDNLVVPAVVHGLYNSVLFGVQYASVAGLLPQ